MNPIARCSSWRLASIIIPALTADLYSSIHCFFLTLPALACARVACARTAARAGAQWDGLGSSSEQRLFGGSPVHKVNLKITVGMRWAPLPETNADKISNFDSDWMAERACARARASLRGFVECAEAIRRLPHKLSRRHYMGAVTRNKMNCY